MVLLKKITSNKNKMAFQIETASTNEAFYDSEYFEKTWKVLEQAINNIFKQNCSDLNFEQLYRNAYNTVLYKHGEELYSRLVTTMTTHVKEVSQSIEATQEDVFLEELNRKWADYNKALQAIGDILMYMDRTFIPSTHKTHVHELGINLWRDHIVHFSEIQTRLLNALLQRVNIERSWETTNKVLMRGVMQMLMQTSQATMLQFYASIDDTDLVAEIKNQLQYPSTL